MSRKGEPEMTRVMLVAMGEDSHRFTDEPDKALVLAGVEIPDSPGFLANSDGDLIFHACCHALASLGGLDPVLGPPADKLCKEDGITDSRRFLDLQLAQLKEQVPSIRLEHCSISLEGKRPYLYRYLPRLREAVGEALGLPEGAVGITATTGEGLTDFGKGLGMACRVILTASKNA